MNKARVQQDRASWKLPAAWVLNLGLVMLGGSPLEAQEILPLYSFETDLEGWDATGFTDSDFISIAQSTMGATDGSFSMAIETGPTFGWDVNRTVAPSDLPEVYDAFNTVAGELDRYVLEFDVTLTEASFANVADLGPSFLINVAVNSDEPNFPQASNVLSNLIGVDEMGQSVPNLGTFTASIPMTSLPVAPDSSFYQLNIGSNSQHTNGPGGEGATYFVDNIRFRRLPLLTPTTLFSWETPDDPGTPDVNEQFEGWTEGFGDGHIHAITTTGATEGSSALQIDRTSLEDGFAWGSQFAISSVIDEEGTIDPEIQVQIDDLASRIESAEAIAFDVTYQHQDLFPAQDPTFTNLWVHFSDETGVFYQAGTPTFDVVAATEPMTETFQIPLSEFDNVVEELGELNLKEDGFLDGTSFLRIGIGSSTNGGQVYQIDNFRLLSIAEEAVLGDFNSDGVVDAADYTVWRDGLGGEFDEEDYTVWKNNFGAGSPGSGSASAAVPEPGSLILGLLSLCLALCGWLRR